MVLQKTSKDTLTPNDILKYIADYEAKEVPHLNDLWDYYKGRNVKILTRKTPDANNPDNRIIVSYARKLITTWTGYGYRPKYITYKPNVKKDSADLTNEDATNEIIEPKLEPIEKQFVNELNDVFAKNKEHIKTNRAGRNTGIFGLSYEVCYIDSEFTGTEELPVKAIPRFFTVDPREMVVLYDFNPEPKIKTGIRFYKTDSDNEYIVEVYYKDRTEKYKRIRKDNQSKWTLTSEGTTPNLFNDVPIVAYYNGDEMQSIIENVLTLIDAYDILFSDSMNEFDRFAFAYLVMKGVSLTSPIDKKDPLKADAALKNLKRRRVFEGLNKDDAIEFLTKNIPTEFIQHIGQQLRDQIHIQSHVPDFTSEKMNGASGIAIQRLMFDFENLISNVEADFDTGLLKRIDLVAYVMKKLNIIDGTSDMVTIDHKRNMPLNTADFANTALLMSNAGFSRQAIVGIMPEDVIPDAEKELQYEKEEQEAMIGGNNFDETDLTEYDSNGDATTDNQGNPLDTNKEVK